MIANTTSSLLVFILGFYCGFSVPSTNTSEYPINWINGGLALIVVIYCLTLPYYMYSKDTMGFEEWTKVSTLPQIYKVRLEGFIQRRFEYTVAWHVYIVYASVVIFYISFYGVTGPTKTG